MRFQLSRTIEIHHRRLHAHGALEGPLETAISKIVDEFGKVVLTIEGVPLDGGAVLTRDRGECSPFVDSEVDGLSQVEIGGNQKCRGCDDQDRNKSFHLFPPLFPDWVSAFREVSISALVAGRGRNFAASRRKPFGPMGTMAPALSLAHAPRRLTTQSPSAGPL